MIFESEDFYLQPIETADIDRIVELYNSNTLFLENHIKKDRVTFDWVNEELESMKRAGFCSYKAVEKNTKKIVGIIDFKRVW